MIKRHPTNYSNARSTRMKSTLMKVQLSFVSSAATQPRAWASRTSGLREYDKRADRKLQPTVARYNNDTI